MTFNEHTLPSNRTWLEELAEANTAQAGGNIGRARTCARRAVGMAIRDTIGIGPGPRNYASTFILALRRLAEDPAFSQAVRAAAVRLADRSKPDRTSASESPADDAGIILRELQARSIANTTSAPAR